MTPARSILRRPEVLAYLTLEIDSLHHERQKPGWTPWALMGSLSGAIWLFIEQAASVNFSLNESLIVMLGCILLARAFQCCVRGLQASHIIKKKSPRFVRAAENVEGDLHHMLLQVVLCAGAIVIVYQNPGIFSGATRAVLFTYFGGSIAFRLLLILQVFISPNIPTLKSVPNTRLTNPLIVTIIFMVFGTTIIYLHAILDCQLSVESLRAGALLFAIFELTHTISFDNTASPLLETLQDLRKNLLLSRISCEDCLRQAEIAIEGKKLEDFFQGELRDILRRYGSIGQDILRLEQQLQTILECSKQDGPGKKHELRHLLLKAAQESTRISSSCRKELQAIKQSATTLHSRALGVMWFVNVEDDFARIQSKLSSAQDDITHRLDNCTRITEEAMKSIPD